MSIVANFRNLLSVTDKNVVELQIIIDESAVVNQLEAIQEGQAEVEYAGA